MYVHYFDYYMILYTALFFTIMSIFRFGGIYYTMKVLFFNHQTAFDWVFNRLKQSSAFLSVDECSYYSLRYGVLMVLRD